MQKLKIEKEKTSFYKRELPNTCISFHSIEGKQIFRSSLEGDFMESYFLLSSQFLTQSEPAYCGLASLCMVLNALQIDPLRLWKGVWRWYEESMLDCCRPLELVKSDGITLQEFGCLAKCNGLSVDQHLAETIDKDKFISDLKRSCGSEDSMMVISFSRSALGQTGIGHFSPVGGYSEKDKKVLILDVARFKYPTYWVDVNLLWESMLPLDTSSKRSRGYAILSKGTQQCAKCYSQLNVDSESWIYLHDLLYSKIPQALEALPPTATVKHFFGKIVDLIPNDYESVVENRTLMFTENEGSLSPESDEAIRQYVDGVGSLLLEVSKLEIYHYVDEISQKRRRHVQPEVEVTVPPIAVTCSPMISPIVKKPSLSFLNNAQRTRMASFASQMSSRASIIEMIPVREDVDNQSAFLTIFLLAFLSSCTSTFTNLTNPTLAKKIEKLITIDSLTVAGEISLLRNQIEALNEYVNNNIIRNI